MGGKQEAKFASYTTQEITEVLKVLESSLDGLTEKEARGRLRIHGPNEVKTKQAGWLDILTRQLHSPFIYLLFLATLIAFLIGEKIDGLVILFFVFLNVTLGFYQEYKAQKAALLLKKYIPAKTRVWRQGSEHLIEKKDLVPGDLVLLEAGDMAPADLRLIKAKNLIVDESVLTGESFPITKDCQPCSQPVSQIFEAKNILFAGTAVVGGKAQGVVVATGKQTALGEITKMVAGLGRESAYEKNLFSFSRLILRIVVVSIVLLFLISLIIRGPANIFDFLIFCIALVVSIIPEALPTVVTFALSQGALGLARQKVVVKRLSAVEDLGDIEILCTDKTGTLTEGRLELEKTVSPNGDKCLFYGLLASSQADPFDLTLFKKADGHLHQRLNGYEVVDEIPFDPARLRRAAVVADTKGGLTLVVKGAPEVILRLSTQTEGGADKTDSFKEIERQIDQVGRQGKRVLAVAYKKLDARNQNGQSISEDNLTFLGYFVFHDPLKKTAIQAVRTAQKLGVKIKMLTGDSPQVAGQVGCQVGLIENPGQVILGEEIEKLSAEKLAAACQQHAVFARVSPQTKFKIVQALAQDYEVGFLGEGINDAPALKIAHVAMVVHRAVDVSREAADIILLKKDLNTIVSGIKQGRQIFANINKYIRNTLASNFGNFYSIAAVSLFIPFLPMLPVQILLVNLLSDFPLIAIASDTVDAPELKKPKAFQLKSAVGLIVLLAAVSTVFDFLFFGIFYRLGPGMLRTLWFVESILTEIVLIFSVRTAHFCLKAKRPSSPLLGIVVLTILITIGLPFTSFGQQAFHFVPPSPGALALVLFLIVGYFGLSETAKLWYFRRRA